RTTGTVSVHLIDARLDSVCRSGRRGDGRFAYLHVRGAPADPDAEGGAQSHPGQGQTCADSRLAEPNGHCIADAQARAADGYARTADRDCNAAAAYRHGNLGPNARSLANCTRGDTDAPRRDSLALAGRYRDE
ncbi:MAG TPA: hypothetical protein VKJ07_06610, partial [Mycobacteriales bacterium]|nr:hypothetical protein [Mycobacteriales bacterium]